MKKIPALLLPLILAAAGVDAQTYVSVPNGSFEQWTPGPGTIGQMTPPPWSTANPGAFNQVVPPVTRSADAVDSNWSVVIRPFRGTCPSFQGCLSRIQYSFNGGAGANLAVPRRLKGMYKFAKDSFLIDAGAGVTFDNGQPAMPLEGGGSFIPVPTSVWTPFTIEIDTSEATSLPAVKWGIIFYLDTKDTSANPVTYWQLDGLRFEYDTTSTGSIEPLSTQVSLVISPNPSKGLTTLSWGQPLANDATALICNITGQTVSQQAVQKGNRSVELTTSLLPSGQYFVSLISPGTYLPPAMLVVLQ